MAKTIFGWSASPGGSEWYRLTLPLRELASQYGWEAEVGQALASHSMDNGQRFSIASPADVTVVQRPMSPVAGKAVKWWASRGSTAIVVELDDDLLTADSGNPVERACSPERRRILRECLERADLVTVSTVRLGEVVSEHTKAPIRVVPNQVPSALIERPRPKQHGHMVTVGWQGSNTHSDDWLAENLDITEALNYSDRIQFHCMGWDYRGLMPNIRCRNWFTPFQADIQAYYDSLAFDVALAPLRRNEFNRSKSDIRIVEAAAIGAVPIMSDWGPYARVSGRHVRGPAGGGDTWRQHTADLVSDGTQRADERRTWKDWARRRTVEGNAWRWNEIYLGVIDGKTA
jgi:hypothetical protein